MKLELLPGSRSRILAALVLGIMAVFVVRLFYLQVIRHSDYVALADQEQIKRLIIPAQRGEIYAMDGDQPVKLVLNEAVYTVFADPKIIETNGEVKIIETMRRIAGGQTRSNIAELLTYKETRYQILAKEVTRKQADLIKEEGLAGIGFQQETRRVYPEGQLAAQTLGFVNGEGKGQYGVEGQLNERLDGEDGMLQSVTDVSNVPLTIGDRNIDRPAQNGDNLVLTLDRNIQSYTEKALFDGMERSGATHGSVMVMDPENGRIMAMANLPTYKPAEYNTVQNGADFTNDTISVPYEAGSVIKTLTVATGIDQGVIEPDSTYLNTDRITVEDRVISNATKGQTGVITMQTALDYSLNTGMVTIAQRLGGGDQINQQARNTMYEYYYDRFGLGQTTGVQLGGEARGSVIAPTELEGNAVRYSNMSFGQGMNVTMVQVAAAFSSVINGGTYNAPSVIRGVIDDDGAMNEEPARESKRVISQSTSDKTRGMINTARETFYSTQDRPGYEIGGKTGTSQTIDESGRYVDNETIATYLGYGGDDQPQYVIMVQVSGENMNLEGGKHAAPIFTDISNWMIDYLKLQPKE